MSVRQIEPGYSTVTLDLGIARDKVRMPFAAGLFVVLHTTGLSNKITVQFNTDQAGEIAAYRNFKFKGPFNMFYLSNDVQSGQEITIIIMDDPDRFDVDQLRIELSGGVNLGTALDADEKLDVDTTGELLAAADTDRLSLTLYVEKNGLLIGPTLADAKYKVPVGAEVPINNTTAAVYGKSVVGVCDVFLLMQKQ